MPFYIDRSQGLHTTASNTYNTRNEFPASWLQPHSFSHTNSEYPRSHPDPTFSMFSSLLKLVWFILSLLKTGKENCMVICRDNLIRSATMKKCLACPGECVVLELSALQGFILTFPEVLGKRDCPRSLTNQTFTKKKKKGAFV